MFVLYIAALVTASGSASGRGVIVLVALAAYLGLNIWVPGRLGGTVGMLACSMRILRQADGSAIGYGLATGRFAAYFVLNIVPFMFIIQIIVIASDRRHQGIHDKICSTVVVRPG